MSLAQLEDLVQTALHCGLIGPDKRRVLLHGLPMGFVYSLPTVSRPIDQLRFDLMELERTPRLIGLDRPPLAVWMQNAAAIAAAEGKPDAARAFARKADALVPSGTAVEATERRLAEAGHGTATPATQAPAARAKAPAAAPEARPTRIHVLALDSAGKGNWRTAKPSFEATTVHEVDLPTGDWVGEHAPYSGPWRTLRERIDRAFEALTAQVRRGDGIRVFTRDVPPAVAALVGSRLARRLPSAEVEYFHQIRLAGRKGWRAYGPCWPDDIISSSQPVLTSGSAGIEPESRDVALCIQVDRRISRKAVDAALDASGITSAGRLTLSHDPPQRDAVVEPGDIERALADCRSAIDTIFEQSLALERVHLFFSGPPALAVRMAEELTEAHTSVTVYVKQRNGYAPAVLLAPRTDAQLVPGPSRPEGKDGYDVFLSFADADRELARKLDDRLTARGLSVFLDERSILFGDVWTESIPSALTHARSVVALLSPRPTTGSGTRVGWYQDEELIQAIRQTRRAEDAMHLFPVLLGGMLPDEMPHGLQGFNALRVPDNLGPPGAAPRAADDDTIAGFVDARLKEVLPEPSKPTATV